MKMHMNFMRSSGGKRDVAYYVYVPDGEVRGIVQISHGMCDYVENYALLAERLTAAGLVVWAMTISGTATRRRTRATSAILQAAAMKCC